MPHIVLRACIASFESNDGMVQGLAPDVQELQLPRYNRLRFVLGHTTPTRLGKAYSVGPADSDQPTRISRWCHGRQGHRDMIFAKLPPTRRRPSYSFKSLRTQKVRQQTTVICQCNVSLRCRAEQSNAASTRMHATRNQPGARSSHPPAARRSRDHQVPIGY